MRALAQFLLVEDIWTFFSGHVQMDVLGMSGLVHVLLKEGIWKYFSGHEQMDVPGISTRAHMLLMVGTSPFLSGHGEMDVRRNKKCGRFCGGHFLRRNGKLNPGSSSWDQS